MRRVVGVAAALAMGMATVAYGVGATTAAAASKKSHQHHKRIVIGLVAGTTGSYGTTGIAMVNATKMVVHRINHHGGVMGRKLKLEWGNDAASSTKSALLFKKFVNHHAVAMFGSGDTATVTVSLADKYHIPDLGVVDDGGVATYPTGPTKPPRPWVWSGSLNTYAWGQVVGDYANKSCPTGLAMLHDPTYYGLGGLAGVKQTYKKKLLLTDSISEDWSSGATQNTISEIQKVKASGADCVDVWLTPQDDAVFVKEMHSLGDHFTVLGNDETCSTTTFAKLAGATATGMLCAELSASFAPSKKVKKFDKQYKKKFHRTATAYTLVSYDAVRMLKKAIDKGKSTSDKSIEKQLNHMKNFHGLSGTLTFTKQKHVAITAPQLTLVRYSTSKQKWVSAKY